jgi:hypothetical protein
MPQWGSTSVADTGPAMWFLITGTDTAGSMTVRRDTAVAALKKAAELDRDGCWDIAITGPDGRRYTMREFDQLPAHGGVAQFMSSPNIERI